MPERAATLLTCHAVAFGGREGRGVHVGDAARGEVVVGLLGGEVEKPVVVAGEEGETVELSRGITQTGVQGRLSSFVDGFGVLGDGGEQKPGGQDGLAEHLVRREESHSDGRFGVVYLIAVEKSEKSRY